MNLELESALVPPTEQPALMELNEVQLALIGGGIGETILV